MLDEYNIFTIKVIDILKHLEYTGKNLSDLKEDDLKLDLTDRFVYCDIVDSVDIREDNAYFYQIKAELNNDNANNKDRKEDKNLLKHKVIYMDFNSVFFFSSEENKKENSKYESAAKKILEIGFTLKLSETEEAHFVRGDKSSSMARNGHMFFIDEGLIKALEKRLMLDINLGAEKAQTGIAWSKMFAYRGLYLSSAQRISELELNQNTVIVIEDDYCEVRSHKFISAKEDNQKNTDLETYWDICEPSNENVFINTFDGEGFICPEYAGIINAVMSRKTLNSSNKLEAPYVTSFQIRMPFIKGMLHQVDYHKFVNEFVNENIERGDTAFIKDVFGKMRDLSKAKIILTKSMFKACKWLKDFYDNDNKIKEKYHDDIMEFYFSGFRIYSHALYISNTDTALHNNGNIRLNYQFLNTLQPNKEELESMVKHHLELAGVDNDSADNANENTPENIPSDEVKINSSDFVWKEVMRACHDFKGDSYTKEKQKEIEQSYLCDIIKGRLLTEGECRFLSGDLPALLIHILKLLYKDKNGKEKYFDNRDNKIEKLQKNFCVLDNKFYMPGVGYKNVENGEWCTFLRNPHLSRNEICYLQMFRGEENNYNTYFGHLYGIVMLGYHTLAAMALGGADYDGDLVKVVFNKDFNDIVKVKTVNEVQMVRTLPIIKIPSPEGKISVDLSKGKSSADLLKELKIETIKNTFSTRVGYISNRGIQIGKTEYGIPEHNTDFNGKSAYCTILTGLEIDSVKNGSRPSLEPIKELDLDKSDYYLKTKNELLELFKSYKYKFQKNESGKKSPYSFKPLPYGKEIQIKSDKGMPYMTSIDRLLLIFAEKSSDVKKNALENPTRLKSDEKMVELKACMDSLFGEDISKRFFVKKNGIMTQAKFENKKEIRSIVGEYKDLKAEFSRCIRVVNQYKHSKYSACIKTLLHLRYDNEASCINDADKISVGMARINAYGLLEEAIPDEKAGNAILDSIVNSSWAFIPSEKRKEMLLSILFPNGYNKQKEKQDISDSAITLLTDFHSYGYKLLYYFVKDVICRRMVNSQDIPTALNDNSKKNTLLSEGITQRFTTLLFLKKLIADRRLELAKLVEPDHENDWSESEISTAMHKIAPDVYALGTNQSSDFFWEIFSADEILQSCAKKEVEVTENA